MPEIKAINLEALFEAEKEGFNVIPNADAVNKTMNRKNIREFVAKYLKIKTGNYEFVSTLEDLGSAAYKAKNDTYNPEIIIDDKAFTKDSLIRVFGKPQSHEGRRMAIILTYDKDSSEKALDKAKKLITYIEDK